MSEEISNFYVHIPVPDDSESATLALVQCSMSLKRQYVEMGFVPMPTRFMEPDVIILTFRRESKEVRIHLRPV